MGWYVGCGVYVWWIPLFTVWEMGDYAAARRRDVISWNGKVYVEH